MSVIVMGMEMPENCYDCLFVRASWGNDYYCAKGNGTEDNIRVLMSKRMDDCPLIEVPTPHGRLIDADELSKQKYENIWTNRLVINADDLDDAPTVIEAEE